MWGHRRTKDDHSYVDLHATPPDVRRGSYNRRWNAQVLRGLEELDRIRRVQLSIHEAATLELPTGDVEEPHEWERVELKDVDLHDPQFFATVWEPWRLQLMAGSYRGLEGSKALLQPNVHVCRLLAEAYSPGDAVTARFGITASFVKPLAECGRCPGCRSRNVSPPEDPPPRVPSRWIVEQEPTPLLEAVITAAPTAERVAVVLSDDPTVEAPVLARELARVGVRFFAGVDMDLDVGGPPWWFVDDGDVIPDDLPPVPGLIVPPRGEAIHQAWLVSSMRPSQADGRPVPLVFLVSPGTSVGSKSVPVEHLPILRLHTAMATLKVASI
jgi:hypothetical protein